MRMQKATVTISNKLGLHARASAKLTKLAGSFACDVHMSRNGRRINAKSIMGVMMLAAGLGSEVDIETDGADEGPALQALVALVQDRFGEGE
jgi:phosphocarrier protein